MLLETIRPARNSIPLTPPPAITGPWFWPLPRLGGCNPAPLGPEKKDDRLGVELGYERDFGSPLYVPVYAAQNGVISFASRTSNGYALSIDHAGRWSTHYAHLDQMFTIATTIPKRRKPARVRAGDVIGYAARSPVHVRFELWQWTEDKGYVPVEPLAHMTGWRLLPDHDAPAVGLRATAEPEKLAA